ncbi:carbon-nitrogen hydrolase family protein [Helicobacter himalayensis]|uniref:carbon-nitrogen hydrolase family protein n=1 Tax=Helicobacter himalayensis TaxID=1591088 RepID=UPI003D6E630A
MNFALLQIAKLENLLFLQQYLQTCQKQGVSLLCFPEYVFEPFFKKLENLHSSTLLSRANAQKLEGLQDLSAQYKIRFIAPMLLNNEILSRYKLWGTPARAKKNQKLYKTIAFVSESAIELYLPQRLIDFPHWSEKEFFANPINKKFSSPLTFFCDGLKVGVLSGFELHFDSLFVSLKKQEYDMLIAPCSNTFDSFARWRSLCKMRAFLNSCTLLRINRVGHELIEGNTWNFYGDSLYVNAYGQIEDSLQEYEGLLIASTQKSEILKARETWGFHKDF